MFDAIAQNWGADGPGKIYGQNAALGGPGFTGEVNGNTDPRIGMNTSAMGQIAENADVYKRLGFNEPVMIQDPNGQGENGRGQYIINPAFTQWLAQKGYTPVSRSDESGQHGALQDANGQIVPGSLRQWGDGSDDAFGGAFGAAVIGLTGGLASGAIGTGAAGGAAGGSGLGLAGQEGLQTGIGAGGGFQGAGAAGVAGTYDVPYTAYDGPGSTGFPVAGNNAVAPAGFGSDLSGAQAIENAGAAGVPGGGGYGSSMLPEAGAGMATAGGGGGGGLMSQAGNAMSDVGTWAKSNPGLVGLGGTLANGLIGSYTAGKALDAQRDATTQANALWKPYRDLGTGAVGRINGLMQDPSSITSDPGYKFGLDQGVQGIDRGAASRGSLYSGATLKALDRYGTDYAGTKLNEAYSRYGNVAQLGATGTTNSANNITNFGQAGAGAALYQGNTWQNALNGGLAQWNASQYQQKPGP